MVNMEYGNVTFPESTSFHCKKCGVCCRDQPSDINLKEQLRIEAKGFVNFLESPNDSNNRSIRRKKDGRCFFLSKLNTCKIQDIKPSICILDPFIIKDFDYKAERIIIELNPAAVKNCKGIFSGEMGVSEEVAKAAQNIVKDTMEIVAAKTGLPITDKKVGLFTRELLRH